MLMLLLHNLLMIFDSIPQVSEKILILLLLLLLMRLFFLLLMLMMLLLLLLLLLHYLLMMFDISRSVLLKSLSRSGPRETFTARSSFACESSLFSRERNLNLPVAGTVST